MEAFKNTILIKTHKRYIQIPYENIQFCKAEGCYTNFYLTNGTKSFICGTLKSVEKCLPPKRFLRIHNSILVNKDKISSFSSKHRTVCVGNMPLPISKRKYRLILFDLLINCIPDL